MLFSTSHQPINPTNEPCARNAATVADHPDFQTWAYAAEILNDALYLCRDGMWFYSTLLGALLYCYLRHNRGYPTLDAG